MDISNVAPVPADDVVDVDATAVCVVETSGPVYVWVPVIAIWEFVYACLLASPISRITIFSLLKLTAAPS